MGSSMVIVCTYGDRLMAWRKGVSRPLAWEGEWEWEVSLLGDDERRMMMTAITT